MSCLKAQISLKHGGFQLDAEFSAPNGVTVVVGPSGSGKTSLLRAVLGALRPQAGRITLDGQVFFDAKASVHVALEQRRIGMVFQEGRLFPHLTVQENLLFGAKRLAVESSGHVSFDEAVAVLGIAPLLARRPATLSGGERQRVALGRALLAQPKLLLMDEPLASVDAERRDEIASLVWRLSRRIDIPILYITHSFEETARLADQVLVLTDGRISAAGGLADVIMASPHLRHAPGLAVRLEGHWSAEGQGEAAVLTPAGPIIVSQCPSGVAEHRAALLVRASDVVLAVGATPQGLSARNILAARTLEMTDMPGDQVLVRLRAGEADLLSIISHTSVARLGLQPGAAVYAVIKASAIGQ